MGSDERYAFGDYVVYKAKSEVGRVTNDLGAKAFVCFHRGCTAALTPKSLLWPATAEEIASADPGLGHHRFDDEPCPDFEPEACAACQDRFRGGDV